MIFSLSYHQRVKLLIDLVNFSLTRCHEPALRVNVAKWPLHFFAFFLFLIDDFIRRFRLNLVLYVYVVDQIEKHGKVLKCDAFDHFLFRRGLFLVRTRRL